jgi:hypothetical protein
MYKLICQKPSHFFICPNGSTEQLASSVCSTWDV